MDLASSIEASLRSSENPFHPDNPEGSIIKDLLLKTRSGLLALPNESAAGDGRGWSLAVLEAQSSRLTAINGGQEADKKAAAAMGLDVIPMPKNILPGNSGSGAKTSTAAEAYYKCDQCQVLLRVYISSGDFGWA